MTHSPQDHSSCPACLSTDLESFYQCLQVPVHTTLLMPTRELALAYPRRDIELAFCSKCGFISNRRFEHGIHEYSGHCEESQGCSPTFMVWLRSLALRLINDYKISQQSVLEIGSGKGEFLAEICDIGDNHGTGYDPAYVPGRLKGEVLSRIDFRKKMWDLDCGLNDADLIICRHTLEHIPNVLEFMQDIRCAIGDKLDTLLFFEVPDTDRVLKEGAFWDIYYEHCSYFSKDSLCNLFRISGFEVLECWLDYDDQYIMLVAKPVNLSSIALEVTSGQPQAPSQEENIDQFRQNLFAMQTAWTARLASFAQAGTPAMLWGGGSKAAAFLNQLHRNEVISKVIDINPHKQHCFIPASGQEVIGPDLLRQETPEVIILMNPVYRAEVQKYLDDHGYEVELLSVNTARAGFTLP